MSAEVRAGYKQTEVGVIPEDWLPKTIGEVCEFSGGSQPPRSTFKFASEDGYVRLIQIRDYKTDDYASYIPASMARKTCTSNDIMIGRYGPPVFQILRGIEGAYNVALIKAIPNGNIHPDYLFNVLRQERLFNFIDGLSRRSSGQTGVEMSALRGYPLPLPPLPEQRAIASALADVDALLASLEALLTKKRQLKQAAMQELLTGKTRLDGFDGEWKRKKFEDVMDGFSSGATPFRGRKDYYTGDINWITSGELNYNIINTTKEKITPEAIKAANLNLLPSGTFLIAITGLEAAGTRGSCGIVGKPSTSNQSCMALYPKTSLSLSFLFHYYCCFGETLAFEYCQGTKQQSYTGAIVKKLPIYLPENVSEQQAIASILSEMDTELDALTERMTKTRQLKQGMMQELLTGRTRLI